MADLRSNQSVWTDRWDWSTAGHEWSEWWGGTPAMWLAAIQPRLAPFLPTGTVLEIAPGFGRWTHYLKEAADRLVLVDLTQQCIDHCRERFSSDDNVEYHVNDGRSLEMVEDASIDLVVSLDSLVHADETVLDAYLSQLAAKLSADGVGVIHHSNLHAYRVVAGVTARVPPRYQLPLARRGVLPDLSAWRDRSMSARKFAEMCGRHGLSCIAQEEISWEHGRYRTDALSVFTRPGSRWDMPHRVVRNASFRDAASPMRGLWGPLGRIAASESD